MTKIKAREIKPMNVAYIEHVGEYDKIPWDKYMEKLFAWAKEHKVRPGFKGIGIYYDNPEQTLPKKCRSEIAIPIKGTASSGKEIKVKEIPQSEVAETKFHGSSDEIAKIYKELGEWIEKNGYEWNGPCMEIYGRKPKNVKGKTVLHMTLQVPIKKK